MIGTTGQIPQGEDGVALRGLWRCWGLIKSMQFSLQSGGKPARSPLARGSAVSIDFAGSCASLLHGKEETEQRAKISEGGNSGCDRANHNGASHQVEMAAVL